ncbi:MAG TPA: hypothetical protein VII14_19990 [Xanthobacteraceae bacterium]
MLTITAGAAALLFTLEGQPVWAQDEPALAGTVSSEAEGNMEGSSSLRHSPVQSSG